MGILDGLNLLWLKLSCLEEWRVVDVGRIFPLINQRLLHLQIIPSLGPLRDVVVYFSEHFRFKRVYDNFLGLLSRWPNVLQVDFFSGLVRAESLSFEIKVNGPCKGIGYNKWRRGKVGCFHHLVNSRFKVSIS